MEEDEFSDFEKPVDPHVAAPLQTNSVQPAAGKVEVDLWEEGFLNLPPASINPSSSLATQSIGQPGGDTDSKDLAEAAWPHFSKIMSENLQPPQPHLLAFEKSHSQTEHQIGIFDASTSLFTQNTTHFSEKTNPFQQQFLFQDYANTQSIQTAKIQQTFTNSQSIDPFIGFSGETKILGQVRVQDKEQQKDVVFSFQSPLNQPLEKIDFSGLNQHIQETHKEENGRKQSEEFVFQEQVHQQESTHAETRKESEEFVFQETHTPLDFTVFSTQPQENNNEDKQNLEEAQTQEIYQNHSESTQQATNPTQIDAFIDNHNEPTLPKTQSQPEKPPANISTHIDEDDQFGEFEETATHPSNDLPTPSNSNQPGQPSMVELYEQVAPYGIDLPGKRQELQELVNALPDYSWLFAAAQCR